MSFHGHLPDVIFKHSSNRFVCFWSFFVSLFYFGFKENVECITCEKMLFKYTPRTKKDVYETLMFLILGHLSAKKINEKCKLLEFFYVKAA